MTAAEVPDVLDECAQFLGGQFLESYREDRDSAPDWVWVNVLAHASEELLATCAAAGGTPSRSSGRCVWDRTLSFLSQVLLDHAGRTGVPVSLLQHDIVVPIELPAGGSPPGPADARAPGAQWSARARGVHSGSPCPDGEDDKEENLIPSRIRRVRPLAVTPRPWRAGYPPPGPPSR